MTELVQIHLRRKGVEVEGRREEEATPMSVFGIEAEFGRLCRDTGEELSPRELDRLRAITLFREIRNARGGSARRSGSGVYR